jgi:hypothetical protein
MPTSEDLKFYVKSKISHLSTNAYDELTEWERNFLESIEEQFNEFGSLSKTQLNKLDQIYEEH